MHVSNTSNDSDDSNDIGQQHVLSRLAGTKSWHVIPGSVRLHV